MKRRISIILVVVLLFSIYSKNVLASNVCSLNGYSIFTINGIFTNEDGAKENRNNLKKGLPPTFNNQPLKVDFLYNATHLGGLGDAIDAVQQGLFDQKSDYDLTEMLNDASQKVTTQKLLLVAHSQGNFYANNFYDKVASKEGGVPSQSIGVYGVATPANYVAGGGKYLTSDTDKVITATVARFIKILTPNIHIPLQNTDGNGHSFSDVYLKYQGDRIISDIKSSLNQLKENDEQEPQDSCISKPELTALHKITGVALTSADFLVNNTKKAVVYVGNGIYNAGLATKNIFKGLLANVVDSLPSADSVTTILPNISESSNANAETTPPSTEEQTQTIKEDIAKNETKTNETVTTVTETPSDISMQPAEAIPPQVSPVPEIVSDVSSTSNGGGNGGGGGGDAVNNNDNNNDENKDLPVEDKTAPVITIVGTNSVDITKDTLYTDEGATALDDIDGVRDVVMAGAVDTTIIGTYTITYTATDISNNIATATRIVNVIAPVLVPDLTPPIITINGNVNEVIKKDSVYTDAGAIALDDIDGALEVEATGVVNSAILGDYIITYTATDAALNISTKTRTVTVSTNIYVPKYSFGKNNGDGNNWQVWSFNGSNVYDWSDTYVDNYLREQFKIQTYTGGFWCSQCLQRGIFTHDPQKGFEFSERISSSLENNPQNNMNGITYDVAIQWDSFGYTYTISHDTTIDATGHTDVPNMNNNLWVGWDGSFNNFQTFPSGSWQETIYNSPLNRTGGGDMMLQPFPVYRAQVTSIVPTLSLPNKGAYAGRGISPTRGRKTLTPFTFQVIYTDTNNSSPQNIKLHVTNTTNGITLSEVEMQKISGGIDILNDGNFTNGEAYISDDILYDIGEYNYYFSAIDNTGNQIIVPENETLNFEVIPSTYTYIPKYSFGTNNGDGNNWQVWSFNGSNVYDWLDTYVDSYLKEQFKIQTYPGGYWCSQCLQRGIFNHDPQKGFEATDKIVSSLENNVQNNMNGITYDVAIQWDAAGYTYTISHDGINDSTGHTDIANVDKDMWVGWDGSFNNFQTFPSGSWQETIYNSPLNRTGGGDMVLQPYQVYDPSQVSSDPLPVLSSLKVITTFNFAELTSLVAGVIDETEKTISLTVPFGTVVSALVPTITISEKATINPNTNVTQDFSNPVTYTVTAENGSTQEYIVTVTIAPNSVPDPVPDPIIDPVPDPVPDIISPSITSYTYNSIANDITINPTINPLTLVLNASENVNWMSIKIEKEDNASVYKTFQSGANCVDGTNICTKIWDGILSKGGLLESQTGIYRVKVHIKDTALNEFYDYISPYKININIP